MAPLLVSVATWSHAAAPPTEAPKETSSKPTESSPKPKEPSSDPGLLSSATGAFGPTGTFSAESFQTDLFTGAATATLPITVPAAAGSTAPIILLRYNSQVVDEMTPTTQAQSTGLGWTLDVGGSIIRDLKETDATGDDTFKLIFHGASHDLVLVDAAQNLYRTKDEMFLKVQYISGGDYWLVTAKDGTKNRFGFTADSKGYTLLSDGQSRIAFRYFLDEATSSSGVSIRYAYAKASTTLFTGGVYDQAIYPSTITYSYASGALVGPAREVRFVRAPRTDWSGDSGGTASLYFFERDRIEAIEVRVGTSLVRKYVLGYDYSIDRDPTYTWWGGATGDLTLRSITLVGSDGATALPPMSFSYTNARVSQIANGIGGTVSFTYEPVGVQIYAGCWPVVGGRCDAAPTTTPPPLNPEATIHPQPFAGSAPLYRACPLNNADGCLEWSPSTQPWGGALAVLLGHMDAAPREGTVAIYAVCVDGTHEDCRDVGVTTQTTGQLMSIVGYGYRMNRYRISARTTTDGRGGSVTMTYTYSDFAMSTDGKEFRGHASVRATDPAGHYTDTWFKQDDLLKGRPYDAESRSADGALYLKVVNTWSTSNPYPGVTFVRLSQRDTYTCDGTTPCRLQTQTHEHDSYGNLTRTFDQGDVSVTGDERDGRTDWLVDTTTWIHRPSRTALYDGGATLLRETWTSYDGLAWGSLGTRGLQTREESRFAGGRGNSGNPVVTFGYDAYGNRTTTTDPRNCTTTTTFESSKTYPSTVKTCLGHQTAFSFDARWGVRLSETDPNGQQTTYTYDVLGRPTKVTGPLDTSSTYGTVSTFYRNLGDPNNQHVETFRTEQHGTSQVLWSRNHFDGLGRAYRTEAEGPQGQTIQADTTFDARGLVSARSAPRFTTEGALWTTFTYDPLGRQIRVTHPDGTFATAAFAPGLTTLTNERGHVRRKYSDVHGRLTAVDEINGAETYTTRYTYNVAGALTRVTNHFNQQTTISYDLLGRKTGIVDPNMGSWTYAYDKTGNLTSQRDAKNQTLTFTYDSQGRIKTKTYPGGAQITWTYDDPAVAYAKGRVTQIADLATTTRFSYDRLGRVTQTQRTLDSVTYALFRTYDALGRVTDESFTDNVTLFTSQAFGYNSAGWLSFAYAGGGSSGSGGGGGGQTGISSITYNARGQRLALAYTNGVTTQFTYHPTTFRETNRTTTGPGGTLQDLAYQHDNLGNITQITDAVATGSRTFTYDPLNRLTSASGPFGPLSGGLPTQVSHTYRYNAIGNITELAGSLYAYSDPAHPSAVTSTSSGMTMTYDANGNMLTGGGRSVTWDADNRVTATSIQGGNSASFAYDVAGMRVRKTTSAGATRYPFANYEIGPDGALTSYTRLGDMILSAAPSAGARFYHPDHLGGVNQVTDASGTRVQLVEYQPFGMVSRSEGSADLRFRFTGKELDDPEFGLHYYGGRYYSAKLARFISADPFVPSPGNPQSLNRYSYVDNNPVNFLDPSGFKKKPSFFRRLIGAVVGAVVGVVVGVLTENWALGFMAASMVNGAIVGGVKGAAEGALIGGGFVIGGIIGGAVATGLSSQAQGGSFTKGFAAGLISGTAGVAGGIVGAAVAGGVIAEMYGGDFWEGAWQAGVTAAVVAAVTLAGYKAAEWLQSPSSATGSEGGGQVRWRVHFEITKYVPEWADTEFQQWSGYSLRGMKVFLGEIEGGNAALTVGNWVILDREKFFALDVPTKLRILGHEFWHVIQNRIVHPFDALYAAAQKMFGPFRNPYEVTADAMGAAFATHMTGRPVPMDPRFVAP